MKTENKKSNQTCFQNSNLLKMKTVFRKWKQKMKTENKNANQTHPKRSLVHTRESSTFSITLSSLSISLTHQLTLFVQNFYTNIISPYIINI